MTDYLASSTAARRHTGSPEEMKAWVESHGATADIDAESGALVVATTDQTIIVQPGEGLAVGPPRNPADFESRPEAVFDHLSGDEFAARYGVDG